MISINGTFIIQILNFLLAWFIIDRFLLRYLFQITLAQEHEQKLSIDTFIQSKNLIKKLQQEKCQNWSNHQKTLIDTMPNITSENSTKVSYISCPIIKPMHKESLNALTKTIAQQLAWRIIND